MIDESDYWTLLRRELVHWLEDRAPSFVEGYVGAVRLLYMPSFPGRVHFICHAVRDIYRFLPQTLGAKSLTRSFEAYPNLHENLVQAWEQFPAINNDERQNSYVSVRLQVLFRMRNAVRKIAAMDDKFETQRTVGQQFAVALFRSIDRQNDDYIAPWIFASFDAEYKFFVSRAHLAVSVEKIPTDDGLLEHFDAFERAFHSLVGSYFTGKEELDEILQETNTTTG